MSEISQTIQDKCLAFSDRIINLNDYLLEQAASRMSDGRSKKAEVKGGKSAFRPQPSSLFHLSIFNFPHISHLKKLR